MTNPSEALGEVGKHLVVKKLFEPRNPQEAVTEPLRDIEQVAEPLRELTVSERFLPSVRHFAARSLETASLPFRPPQDVTDPLSVKQRLLETPNAGVLFPIAGQALGAMTPLPFVGRVAGGGLGGAIGEIAEQYQQAKHAGRTSFPPDATSQIAKSAGLSAAFSALPSPQAVVSGTKQLFGTLRLGKQLGLPSGAGKSAERLAFVKGIQQEVAGATAQSGEQVGARIAQLTAEHPERQATLATHATTALDKIRTLVSQNPLLHREVLKSAEQTGVRDLTTGLIPELQMSPTAEGRVVTQAEAGFKQKLFEQMREQGAMTGVSPETVTADHLQRLKRVFARVAGMEKGATPFRGSLTHTQLDAAEAYGTIREAELAIHPELAQEFARHKSLMDHFRQVKSTLANLSSLETGMRTGFGETAANQEAFKALLSPQSLMKTQMFADASTLSKMTGLVARRAALYGAMVPLYTIFSLMRGELLRAAR